MTQNPGYETIQVEVSQHIATITFDRPEKRNAMSPQLHRDMTAALEDLRYRDEARVLVLTGSGPSFCAGMDLREFFTELKDFPDEYDRVDRMASEWRGRTLRHYPKPTIAAVNGYCFGGAFSIVEACDIAVAAQGATFGLSEVNFGMLPGGPVSYSIATSMRPKDALLHALTGEPFDGDEALRIGLVSLTVPDAELTDRVRAIAASVARKDPVALRATKRAFHASRRGTLEDSLAYTGAAQAEITLMQDDEWRRSGIGAFLGKQYRPGLADHSAARRPE